MSNYLASRNECDKKRQQKPNNLCPICGKPCYYEYQTAHDNCLAAREVYNNRAIFGYKSEQRAFNQALDRVLEETRARLSLRVQHKQGTQK